MNVTELAPAERFDGQPLAPLIEPATALFDESKLFKERLAGWRILYTGRFTHTDKLLREVVAKELGATVTTVANAKVTHKAIGVRPYTTHKPASGEHKIHKLIDEGHAIEVLNEQQLLDLLMPTVAELSEMLRNDQPRWAAWRKRLPWNFHNRQWRGVDAEGVDLTQAALCDLMLPSANLRRANLRSAKLDSINFMDADLAGANLSLVKTRSPVLTRANLRGASLCGAYLHSAKLDGADLSGADLSGADLREANLTKADLSGASYDEATQWPEGFSEFAEMNKSTSASS